MELTGLKHAINTGVVKEGGSLNNTESSSRTLGYKLIKNASLPKFKNGWADDFGGWGNTLFNNTATSPISVNNISVSSVPQIVQQGVLTGYTPGMFDTTGVDTPKQNITPSTPAVIDQNPSQSAGGFKKTSKGSGIGISGIGNVVTSGILFAGDAINSFSVNESAEEIAARLGTSNMSIGGIAYDSPNMININDEIERVKKENQANTLKTTGSGAALGAAAGSIIPGLGTVAGGIIGAGIGLFAGIFGGESRKRKYRQMMAKLNARINAIQDSSRFSAQTKSMQLSNAREYGNSEALYLYGAADGKQPQVDPNTGMSKNNFLLATPYGYKIGKADSLVEPGETLFDTKTGSMTQVPRQISDKVHPGDILPAEVGDAAVFTDRHKDPITGKSFALAAIDGDDDPYNLLYRQKVLVNDRKNNKGLMKAKNGRLPKFKEGWWSNAIPSGIGMLAGLGLVLEARNSSPRRTNSYRSNLYEGDALNTLASLNVNPYPITQELRNAEARSNRAIDMSGGLTAGQRTLQRLASTTNTQRAIANSLANIQMLNNNYFADYAKTALSTGAANALRAMQAYMWDEDMYAKAHAARQLGMQMGTYNMLNGLQQYYANEFKRQQFNDIMDLYKDDQKIKREELLALLNNNSLAKNMRDYTKKQIGNHLISRSVTNPTFDPTKTLTYKNATGKWLAGYNFNSIPSIPYINIPYTKKR